MDPLLSDGWLLAFPFCFVSILTDEEIETVSDHVTCLGSQLPVAAAVMEPRLIVLTWSGILEKEGLP